MKTRSRPENEKPGNEKLNSRFTLKSPLLRKTLETAKLTQIVLNGLFKLGIALAFRGANELCSCTFFSCKKIGKNLTAIWQLNTLYLVTGYAFMVNQAYQRA